MSEELKPCPSKCGGVMVTIHEMNFFYVRCVCGWEGPNMASKESAIKAWNTRPDSKPDYKYATFSEWYLDSSTEAFADVEEGFNAARELKE